MPDVTSGLADFFLHPPLGVLTNHLDYYGPYSGVVELTDWSSTPGPVYTNRSVSQTYGAIIQLNGAIPAGYGKILGWYDALGLYSEDVYDERLVQLVVQHQLLTGAWVTTQLIDVRSFPRMLLWEVSFPGRIGLYVAPGLAFDMHYLLVA